MPATTGSVVRRSTSRPVGDASQQRDERRPSFSGRWPTRRCGQYHRAGRLVWYAPWPIRLLDGASAVLRHRGPSLRQPQLEQQLHLQRTVARFAGVSAEGRLGSRRRNRISPASEPEPELRLSICGSRHSEPDLRGRVTVRSQDRRERQRACPIPGRHGWFQLALSADGIAIGIVGRPLCRRPGRRSMGQSDRRQLHRVCASSVESDWKNIACCRFATSYARAIRYKRRQ